MTWLSVGIGFWAPLHALEAIRRIGPEHVIIASDLGTVVNVPPVEGLKLFVRILLASGVSKQDIRRMCVDNPHELLGL
jgi:predicted metal-dependent TIM-barrel fold hydrolase